MFGTVTTVNELVFFVGLLIIYVTYIVIGRAQRSLVNRTSRFRCLSWVPAELVIKTQRRTFASYSFKAQFEGLFSKSFPAASLTIVGSHVWPQGLPP